MAGMAIPMGIGAILPVIMVAMVQPTGTLASSNDDGCERVTVALDAPW